MINETVITQEELRVWLRELTPLRIHINGPEDPERWIELDEPEEVHLEAGAGAVVRTSGRFRYEWKGLPVKGEIRQVTVRLSPTIVESDPAGKALAFQLDIEGGDLVNVPDKIDEGIVAIINKAITAHSTGLVWNFTETLDSRFDLGPNLQQLEALGTRVEDGEVQVTDHEIRFRLTLRLDVLRAS